MLLHDCLRFGIRRNCLEPKGSRRSASGHRVNDGRRTQGTGARQASAIRKAGHARPVKDEVARPGYIGRRKTVESISCKAMDDLRKPEEGLQAGYRRRRSGPYSPNIMKFLSACRSARFTLAACETIDGRTWPHRPWVAY